jgi:hypothetical protein
MTDLLLRLALFLASVAAVIATAKLVTVAWEWSP